MADFLKRLFAGVRPHFVYDITKWLVFGAISMLVAAAVFLYRYLRGYPRDLVLIGAIFGAAFLLMILAFIISRVGKKRERLVEKSEVTAQAAIENKRSLTFEIVENESEVHVGGGREVRRIEAKIKLRCVKTTDSVIAVRDFHASLHRVNVDASETTIIAQENVKRILDNSNMQVVLMDAGWTLREPISSYRWFIFYLEITPKIQASLSANYFLRITMDAVGQQPCVEDIRVNDWKDAIAGNSLITLRRNYQRTDEIDRRDEEIRRLQGEITQIDTYYQREINNRITAENERDGLNNQLLELKRIGALEKEGSEAELLGTKIALRGKEDELKDAGKRIHELAQEKFAIDNELQLAELKMGQWEWLTKEAEQQKTAIAAFVRLEEVSLGDMTLTGNNPCVRFGVKVTNKSFLDISLDYELEDQVKGKIEFSGGNKTIPLRGTKTVINTAKDIPPGGPGCLTIEVRLIDNEPRVVNDSKGWPDALFHFAGLVIDIVGANRTPDVATMQLEMRNATASAFPVNLLERGQRIRALAEVRGSAIRFYERLKGGGSPVPKVVIEQWEATSRTTLENVYDAEALRRAWERITHNDPIPSEVSSQRRWFETCIVELGAFLTELTGDYINRKTINA
jgi:hypothetical protein